MNDISEAEVEARIDKSAVKLARVMAEPKIFKDSGIPNLSDTYRGQILTDSGELKVAILKDLGPKELANEVMAAGLAKFLGLPVPPAFIGITAPNSAFASRTRLPDGAGLMFASADVCTPSVAQLIIRAPTAPEQWALLKPIVETIIQQPWLGDLYGFDAWAANVDRHVGNILFGAGVWAIDHGRCFTGPSWVPADFVAAGDFPHRLKEWVTPFIQMDARKKLVDDGESLIDRLRSIDIPSIGAQTRTDKLLDETEFQALVAFLIDRIPHVPRAVADALDLPRLI